jgi:hypothetical protein
MSVASTGEVVMLLRRMLIGEPLDTQDQFDFCYREYDDFIFPMTIHPDVSGRPHVLLMQERSVIGPH